MKAIHAHENLLAEYLAKTEGTSAEEFASTVKEFNVNSQLLSKLQCADANLLVELRLTIYEELKEAGMPILTKPEVTALPPGKNKPTIA